MRIAFLFLLNHGPLPLTLCLLNAGYLPIILGIIRLGAEHSSEIKSTNAGPVPLASMIPSTSEYNKLGCPSSIGEDFH